MERVTSYVSITALIVLTTGCVAAMHMPEPPANQSSKIRYVTTGAPGYTHFWRIGQETCPAKVKREFVAGTGPSAMLFVDESEVSKVPMLGSSGKSEKYTRERLIPAGKPFYYEVRAVSVAVQYSPGFECVNTGVFVPKVGSQYELVYHVTAMGKECKVLVSELKAGLSNEVQKNKVDSWRVFYPPSDDASYCAMSSSEPR